jgi:hypothetical protein
MQIYTHADGFGNWHAQAVLSGEHARADECEVIKLAKRKAKNAIRREIVERMHAAKPLPVRVYLSDIERASTGAIRSLSFTEK